MSIYIYTYIKFIFLGKKKKRLETEYAERTKSLGIDPNSIEKNLLHLQNSTTKIN